jgi:EAL domain-containing protein (putative c-di-GMP-specific phosphodiesterase class I)/DNA-binding response OmpR family regulator
LEAARVLIVDDVGANVRLLDAILSGAGARNVRGFTDPEAFMAAYDELEPDVVLLDLHMPHLDGFAVLEMLQARTADSFVPVLVLTADITTETRERALAAGAKDFVVKPFDRTEVLQRVQNLLETRVLYQRLQAHNERLTTALEAERARRRRAAEAHRAKGQRVRSALAGGALAMVYQPIVELGTDTIVGAEALARFAPVPLRPPNVWFDEARDVGLGTELELAAVTRAISAISLLPATAFLALNMSPQTMIDPGLRQRLAVVPGNRIVLELTEHHRVDRYEALWPALDELRAQGVRIAVDDAGSGYSGLQHILRIQPDIVKLDLELTRGIHSDPIRRALASALVSFAADIGAVLVAEGIESSAELEVLEDLGVTWGQGFHWGQPAELPLALPVRTRCR